MKDSAIIHKGKFHAFGLRDLMKNECIAHEKRHRIIMNKVGMMLSLCEDIQLNIVLEKIHGCLEHSNSEALAYFISFIP